MHDKPAGRKEGRRRPLRANSASARQPEGVRDELVRMNERLGVKMKANQIHSNQPPF